MGDILFSGGATGGGGGGGGAVTIADGADVVLGSLADPAITTDSAGTINGKLRGLIKILATVWDSTNGRINVSVLTPPLGSASGTISGVSQNVSIAVPVGGLYVNFRTDDAVANSLNGSLQVQFSKDNGGTWASQTTAAPGTRILTVFATGGPRGAFQDPSYDGSNQQVEILVGPLDTDITNVRYTCTSFTSGSIALLASVTATEPELIKLALVSGVNNPPGNQWSAAKAGAVMVAGSDGSGSTFPLPISSSGSVSQFDPLVRTSLGITSSAAGINVRGSSHSEIDDKTSAPTGTERGLIVRNIPSGTQAVSGTVTTTPPSHASTNVDQWNGNTVDTNAGTLTAGTLRVVLATDQPQLTNALKVDGSGVVQPVSGTVTTSPPANASTNVTQFGGVNVSTGTGASGTGIPRVTVSNDSTVKLWDGTNTAGVDASGGVKVHIIASDVSSGGTSSVDKAAWVAGTTTGTPAMGAFDDDATSVLSEDTLGVVRLTSFRAEHVNLRDSSGNELGTIANPLPVTSSATPGAALDATIQTTNSINRDIVAQLLADIRMELRIMNAQFQEAFNRPEELDNYRNDPYYSSSGLSNVN